jgi:hypothetical protein
VLLGSAAVDAGISAGTTAAVGAAVSEGVLAGGGAALAGEGIAAGAAASGAAGIGAAAAIPYVGWAIAAIGLIMALTGDDAGPAHFTGGRLQGSASQSGFEGMYYGTSANTKENFQWEYPAHLQAALPVINKNIGIAFDEMGRLGTIMGVKAADLSTVTASFDISPAGEGGPAVIASFMQNIGQLTDQIAYKLIPNLADFAKAGETATTTFMRMASEFQQATIDKAFSLMNATVKVADQTSAFKLSSESPLTPQERLTHAQDLYGATLSAAQGGDLDAINALVDISQAYLKEAHDFYASSEAYTKIFNDVQTNAQELMNNTLKTQAQKFDEMGLSLKQIAAYSAILPALDQRIAAAMGPVLDHARIAESQRVAELEAKLLESAREIAGMTATSKPVGRPVFSAVLGRVIDLDDPLDVAALSRVNHGGAVTSGGGDDGDGGAAMAVMATATATPPACRSFRMTTSRRVCTTARRSSMRTRAPPCSGIST